MTWLAGMEGIPTDYRHMEGYGVNTFTLINAEGKTTYVKFHWRPKAGKHCLQWANGPCCTHSTKACQVVLANVVCPRAALLATALQYPQEVAQPFVEPLRRHQVHDG